MEGVAGRVAGPVPAADGRALQIVVPLSTTGGASVLPAAVQEIRERAQRHDGLSAHVTGPGGMAGDLGDIFEGADVRLLTIASIAVLVTLVAVYRSLILPVVVLLSAQLAQTLASVAVYVLARDDVINLNGRSQGALILICIGTATDYALLLVGRYREELRDRESKYEAILVSVHRTAPTILASGVTVILAVLCLLLSNLSSNRGYGPVLALGICASLLATFTFLPSVLALLGRAAFWPLRPRYGSEHKLHRGIWGRTARVIAHRPRAVWAGTAAVLFALAVFVPTFKASGSPMSEAFLGTDKPDSVSGLGVLAEHYRGGAGAPALIVGPATAQAELTRAAQGVAGVEEVTPYSDAPGPNAAPKVVDGRVLLQATLSDPADSSEAEDTVERLRNAVHAANADARVGGTTAINIDTIDAGWADLTTVIPLVLLVVLLLVVVLLRAVAGPLLLIGTVVLSVTATIGLSAIAFNWSFDFPASDASLPLFCVAFLIAVGVDHNIFLMARVREESARLRDTRQGIVRGLTTTGGVITSAGIVLGVTFALFAVLPFLPLVQIAFIIVAGILIDTFIVRALLVPAASYDVGRAIWWPSKLSRQPNGTSSGTPARELADAPNPAQTPRPGGADTTSSPERTAAGHPHPANSARPANGTRPPKGVPRKTEAASAIEAGWRFTQRVQSPRDDKASLTSVNARHIICAFGGSRLRACFRPSTDSCCSPWSRRSAAMISPHDPDDLPGHGDRAATAPLWDRQDRGGSRSAACSPWSVSAQAPTGLPAWVRWLLAACEAIPQRQPGSAGPCRLVQIYGRWHRPRRARVRRTLPRG